MSVLIHSRVRRAFLALAGVSSVALFAGTGAALASCPPQPVSTPFAQWGDTNDYFQVPGGSFEGTPAFLGCSDVDPHIPRERVLHTEEVLRRMGAEVTARLYTGMGHTVNRDEIAFVRGIMEGCIGS